jgi:hypothetical protein
MDDPASLTRGARTVILRGAGSGTLEETARYFGSDRFGGNGAGIGLRGSSSGRVAAS